MNILMDTKACCKNILSLSKQFEFGKITKENFLRAMKNDAELLVSISKTLKEDK